MSDINDTCGQPGLPADLMPLSAAARLLPGLVPGKSIHVRTLWRWASEGKIPCWRIGRNLYVSRGDVLQLARAQRAKLTPATVRTEGHRAAVEELKRRGLM